MGPHSVTATILICLHISVQQFSVNGIAMENSIDSHDDQFNSMIESPYSMTADYNSSSLLGFFNLFNSFSSHLKGNSLVSKLCDLNTVSLEYRYFQWLEKVNFCC